MSDLVVIGAAFALALPRVTRWLVLLHLAKTSSRMTPETRKFVLELAERFTRMPQISRVVPPDP